MNVRTARKNVNVQRFIRRKLSPIFWRKLTAQRSQRELCPHKFKRNQSRLPDSESSQAAASGRAERSLEIWLAGPPVTAHRASVIRAFAVAPSLLRNRHGPDRPFGSGEPSEPIMIRNSSYCDRTEFRRVSASDLRVRVRFGDTGTVTVTAAARDALMPCHCQPETVMPVTGNHRD